MPNVTNPKRTTGPHLRAADIAATYASRLAVHIDNPEHDTLTGVYDAVYADSHLIQSVKNTFNRQLSKNMVQGTVHAALCQKHQIGPLALHYADFLIDTTGRPVKTVRDGILNSIAVSHPRDAALVAQIPTFTTFVNEDRHAVLHQNAQRLLYPPRLTKQADGRTKQLERTYIDFHTLQNGKHRHRSYAHRLGEFYYTVGVHIDDPGEAFAFITDNFDLLIQPPFGAGYQKPASLKATANAINAIQHPLKSPFATLYKAKAMWYNKGLSLNHYLNDYQNNMTFEKHALADNVAKKPKPVLPDTAAQDILQMFNVNTKAYDAIRQAADQVGGLEQLAVIAHALEQKGRTYPTPGHS